MSTAYLEFRTCGLMQYKPTSLYQKGMKVLCSVDRLTWTHTGIAILYEQSSPHRASLSFTHDFDTPDQCVYFAYGYPYVTTHLESFLARVTANALLQSRCLCRTAMGNVVPMLLLRGHTPRPIIYIIGRQHPGETPSSRIIEGLVECLESSRMECVLLREAFEFRIVPMVNVDGVISGNYRSNCAGNDINRAWQFPSSKLHPEVVALKNDLVSVKKRVALFLDVHAHSRKMNSFFYGSKDPSKGKKLFPFVCSRLNRHISYSESAFADDPSKRTTARVVAEQEADVALALTFECSFYGWQNDQAKAHFKPLDFAKLGETLCLAIYYTFIGLQSLPQTTSLSTPKCTTKNTSLSKVAIKQLAKTSAVLWEKWVKQMEREKEEEDTNDKLSQGSSVDPEGFQLIDEEQSNLHTDSPCFTQLDENSEETFELESKLDVNREFQAPYCESMRANNSLLGLSSKEFYKLSPRFPTLKQLENELFLPHVRAKEDKETINAEGAKESNGIGDRSNANRCLKRQRYRQAKLNVSTLEPFAERYLSLDASLKSPNNYKEKVQELRQALKHMLGNHSISPNLPNTSLTDTAAQRITSLNFSTSSILNPELKCQYKEQRQEKEHSEHKECNDSNELNAGTFANDHSLRGKSINSQHFDKNNREHTRVHGLLLPKSLRLKRTFNNAQINNLRESIAAEYKGEEKREVEAKEMLFKEIRGFNTKEEKDKFAVFEQLKSKRKECKSSLH